VVVYLFFLRNPMSYFTRLGINDWNLEEAIKYHKERTPQSEKGPLQPVLDEIYSMIKTDRGGKRQAAKKLLRSLEVSYEE
jgi:hypothetical protein